MAFVQPYVVDTFDIVGAVLSIFTVIVLVVSLPALSVATKVYVLEPSVLNVYSKLVVPLFNAVPLLSFSTNVFIPLALSLALGFITTSVFVHPYEVDTSDIVGAVLSIFTVIVFVVLLPATSFTSMV